MTGVTVLDMPQRSAVWRQARCGRLTGSRAAAMLARHRYGEALTRARLRAALVYEQRTGCPEDDRYVSAAMARAVALEPFAVAAYEARTDLVVRTTGFLRHDRLPVGCSLDGHVGDFSGILEVKAPNTATHLTYWQRSELPSAYKAQITHNLWVSGAQWCDFVSFDDRLPPLVGFFRVRVFRNALDIAGYARQVDRFLAEVERDLQVARTRTNLRSVLRQVVAGGAR